MERLPADGLWWVPGKENDLLTGRIEGEPGSITISILGSFNEEHLQTRTITADHFREQQVIPIVNGLISGKQVTLFDVAKTGEAFSAPGFPRFRYRPRYVLFGRIIDSTERARPRALGIEFSHLLEWYGRKGLVYEMTWVNQKQDEIKWTFRFPEPFRWSVSGYTVTLSSRLDAKNPWDGFEAREHGHLKIRSERELDLNVWIGHVVDPLRSLLRIAILSPIDVKSIRPIFSDELGDEDSGELDRVSCDLVVNRSNLKNPSEKRLLDEEMLFAAKDLSGEILSEFLNTESTQYRARQLFLSYEQEAMFPDDRFLSYVRILESIHRRLFPPTTEKIEAFESRLERIVSAVPEEDRDLIRGSMRYAYEPGLPARLHALVKPWKPLLSGVLGGKRALGDEIDRIAKHRNFLAHELDESERQFTGEKLARVTHLLTAIFRLNALHGVGFTPERSSEIVERTALFSELKRRYKS